MAEPVQLQPVYRNRDYAQGLVTAAPSPKTPIRFFRKGSRRSSRIIHQYSRSARFLISLLKFFKWPD